MPEGTSPEQNPQDGQKGLFSKASELLQNLRGKSDVEGSGLKGDPEAEAQLSEARIQSAADLDAHREQRREQLGIVDPAETQPAEELPVSRDASTQEAPDELDKAA